MSMLFTIYSKVGLFIVAFLASLFVTGVLPFVSKRCRLSVGLLCHFHLTRFPGPFRSNGTTPTMAPDVEPAAVS